jgi:DNA transformation protein and related proteins
MYRQKPGKAHALTFVPDGCLSTARSWSHLGHRFARGPETLPRPGRDGLPRPASGRSLCGVVRPRPVRPLSLLLACGGMTQSFRTYALEQLGRVRADIRDRSMFGGLGIYAGDLFFALIADDTLYFKVDDINRPAFEERGSRPFQPYGESGGVMQYYEVPEDLLEDPDALRPCVEEAIAAARRKRTKRSGRGQA